MNIFLSFLDANNLKKKEVAEFLGVSKQYISQVSAGSTTLSPDKVAMLRGNQEWDTTMFEGVVSKVKPAKVAQRTNLIPLLPFSAVAGYMSDNNGADMFGGESVMFSDFADRGADCAIRVDGNSMWPRYSSGDILAIRIIRDPAFFQWGRVYVLSTTQGCVVKRLFPDPSDEDRIICHSENAEQYPDYKITKGDILAVAIVVGHAGVE